MNKNTKISFVSTSYPASPKDWRGIFISQMVSQVTSLPDTHLSVWTPPGELPDNVDYLCSREEMLWLEELMNNGGIAHIIRDNIFKGAFTAIKLLSYLNKFFKRSHLNTDVYHVNWLQNIIPMSKYNTPLLVTVLGTDLSLLKIPGMTYLLRRVIKNRPCIIAPNADWMVPVLEKNFQDIAQIRSIIFGISTQWYNIVRNWENSKRKWIVVLRVTPSKIGKLFDWGKEIFNQSDDELHLFGPMQEQVQIPNWVHYHGPSHPKELQEKWFPQAAGLISMSLHNEGRPQVMLEAMASGLPILASNIPAHSNLLEQDVTGLLCESEERFNQSIKLLSDAEENRRVGNAAKNWVRQYAGTWKDCANRYHDAYCDLLSQKS